jgi:hypothetical protein
MKSCARLGTHRRTPNGTDLDRIRSPDAHAVNGQRLRFMRRGASAPWKTERLLP